MNADINQWAGRGEPDWRALSLAALNAERVACGLVDTLDVRGRVDMANKVRQAVGLIRAVRHACDVRLHDVED